MVSALFKCWKYFTVRKKNRVFFFKRCLIFFSVGIFFSKGVLILLFFNFSFFLFFLQNYYHFTKGKETARSPKPAVSFPLTTFLFGHGLGRCPKNLATLEVVALATNKSEWRYFFITSCHPELD